MVGVEGKWLEIAAGPGGGFVPLLLKNNSKAKILMNDISFRVLRGWKSFLKEKGYLEIFFAAFDACNMPVKNETFDYIGDLGGFSNIARAEKAITEAYRVLKKGGTMFTVDLVVKEEDIRLSPKEFGRRIVTLPSNERWVLEYCLRSWLRVIDKGLHSRKRTRF